MSFPGQWTARLNAVRGSLRIRIARANQHLSFCVPVCSLTKLITTADFAPLSRRDFCRAGLAAAAFPGAFAGNGFAQDKTPATKKDDGKKPEEKKELTPEEIAAAKQSGKPLFLAKDFPKGWHYHPAEGGVSIEDTWKVSHDAGKAEPFLRCLGKPYGYLRTKENYDNYKMGLKWRFPADPNGNSGILLHTSGKDQIWPSSIQIQLHRPKVGHVFASGEAKADNQLTEKVEPRELNVWNECVVECKDGRITVEINKKKIGELTGCSPNKGMIALQSEGSEIHFQSVWIRKLTADTST